MNSKDVLNCVHFLCLLVIPAGNQSAGTDSDHNRGANIQAHGAAKSELIR